MFDTLAVAQQLAAGGVARDQAEVIAHAIRQGAEQGDHVTSDQFKAGLAELRTEIAALDTRVSTEIAGVRTEIANLETRLVRWMVGTVIATATLTVGILRLMG
jgi:flagellar biosynthesis/type III secretory pathway protein FliH